MDQRPSPVVYQPIGVIRTPYVDIAGMPVQPPSAAGVAGRVEVAPAFAAGLRDLDGFSHLILLYHLHLVRGVALEVVPFFDTELTMPPDARPNSASN